MLFDTTTEMGGSAKINAIDVTNSKVATSPTLKFIITRKPIEFATVSNIVVKTWHLRTFKTYLHFLTWDSDNSVFAWYSNVMEIIFEYKHDFEIEKICRSANIIFLPSEKGFISTMGSKVKQKSKKNMSSTCPVHNIVTTNAGTIRHSQTNNCSSARRSDWMRKSCLLNLKNLNDIVWNYHSTERTRPI